ncbi:MAG: diguanylate cyclase [Deltaproteobacteria bacterium]|nr:diguanylate cyclase [Deltaproteobacteria bacterium]
MAESWAPTLDPIDLELLARYGAPRAVDAGAIVFREGEPGQSMFVVDDGELELSFAYVGTAKRVGRGGFFGELALVSGQHARSATATARTAARLREIGPLEADRMIASEPALFARVLQKTCRYLFESERRLVLGLERHCLELERTLDWLRRTEEELGVAELEARTDALTGLYNRRCLEERVERLAATSDLALVLIDADEFKTVNDRFGHANGDEALRHYARRLKEGVRSRDLPVRLGGDELAVLLTGIDTSAAKTRARAIFERLGSFEAQLAGANVELGASVGAAALRPGEGWKSLFSRADAALYRAKAAGRGRFGWEDDPVIGGGF